LASGWAGPAGATSALSVLASTRTGGSSGSCWCCRGSGLGGGGHGGGGLLLFGRGGGSLFLGGFGASGGGLGLGGSGWLGAATWVALWQRSSNVAWVAESGSERSKLDVRVGNGAVWNGRLEVGWDTGRVGASTTADTWSAWVSAGWVWSVQPEQIDSVIIPQ